MNDESHSAKVPATSSNDVVAVLDDNNVVLVDKTDNPRMLDDSSKQDSGKSISEVIDSGLKTHTLNDSSNTPDEDFELKWDDDDDDDPISFDYDKHNASIENIQEPPSIDDNKDIDHKNEDPVILIDEEDDSKPAVEDISVETKKDHVSENVNLTVESKMDDDKIEAESNIAISSSPAVADTLDNVQDKDSIIETSTPVKQLTKVKQLNSKEITSTSLIDSSHHSIKPIDHGLNKPDFMIEIPTQELIDCEDLDSDTEPSKNNSDEKIPDKSISDNKIDDVNDLTLEKEEPNKIADNLIEKDAVESNQDVEEKNDDVNDLTLENEEAILADNLIEKDAVASIQDPNVVEKKIKSNNDKIEATDSHKEIDSNDENVQKSDKDNMITETSENIDLLDDNESNQMETEALKSTAIDNVKGMETPVDIKMERDKEDLNVQDKNESIDKALKNIILIEDDDSSINNETKLLQIDVKNQDQIIAAAVNSILPEGEVTDELQPEIEIQETEKFNEEITSCATIQSDKMNTDVKLTNNETSNVVSKEEKNKSTDKNEDSMKIQENKPSMETEISNEVKVPVELKVSDPIPTKISDPLPSSSKVVTEMLPDSSNDGADDMTDSLGLLAESSRVMEDDEEPEPDEDDDGDDDDDFDPDDDSSNLLTAEHSEDSNPQQSDAESKDVLEEEKDIEGEKIEKEEVGMDIDEVSVDVIDTIIEGTIGEKAEEITKTDADDVKEDKNKTSLDIRKEESVKPEDTIDKRDIDSNKTVNIYDKAKEDVKKSPSKTMKLEVAHPSNVINFVELEESSSEDDIQEEAKPTVSEPSPTTDNKTTVNIPKGVEVMSSGGNTSDIVTGETEVTITGVPKAPVHKPARLNTSEVTIKTSSKSLNEATLKIPEVGEKTEPIKCKSDLEIVSLDSDEEDKAGENENTIVITSQRRCMNPACASPAGTPLLACAGAVRALLAPRARARRVCAACAPAAHLTAWELVEGIKNLGPLLDLPMKQFAQDMVEISDSDSDDDELDLPKEVVGDAAEMLENQLVDMLNDTWVKYKMDERLGEAENELQCEMDSLQKDSEEIASMLKECEQATDKLRNDLYATFEPKRKDLCSITICDMPNNIYSCVENDERFDLPPSSIETRQSKRRMSSANETPSKRPAIPLGYSKTGDLANKPIDVQKDDDELDKDVSVVNLSVEAAPPDLPPSGEPSRPPLQVGASVYAMRHAFGSWLKAKVLDVQPVQPFTVCRVKFEHKVKSPFKVLTARCLAYSTPSHVRMTIGTRVIALFKDTASAKRESFYSGIVAEVPNPVNKYRYLIFFDDGYAQYVQHADTRLVCEFSPLIWEEVHPFSREFVKEYLTAYPERPMVRLHAGQSLKAEWNGKWWSSKVLEVDASLVQVYFEEDKRTEWIYRGSTRLAPLYLELQAAERHRGRPLPRSKGMNKSNMPYVYYSRDEQTNKQADTQTQQQQNEDMRRQRAVAKKSTVAVNVPQVPAQGANLDAITSRVVYYTPKNAVRPYKMHRHACGPACKRTDVLALKDLRTYNPLAKPLLSGWERQIVRQRSQKLVMYRAPCGRRLRNIAELHKYLRAVESELGVDLFDFSPSTHCLAEFVLNKCRVAKKDLSHGKENVPVPCVNYYDDTLPEFCSYNTERTPTAGVPLNLDPEFLCGCDCADDCQDKSKCACWRLTLEGARTIGLDGGVGYVYKRLPDPLPSGIYECNSRCKCKQTCLNRVAQQPLQLKLQVFKTLSRGWGIRALNDVPKGSFLCVYAGNLLTDATANLDGLNEGDEYLAELDYIEVVEQMKEGFEDDIPEADKVLDKKESKASTSSSEEESSSEEDTDSTRDEKDDGDFEPGYLAQRPTVFNKFLRKRDKKKAKQEEAKEQKKTESKQSEKDAKGKNGDDCITISDDEEVREPSRFNAQAGMDSKAFVSKHRSVRSHFGMDEACYIMDAKVQGNIGRYLNHSCQPNVFVQNVFVDTHDPRFPWVAFFALSHIKAGTELTWNYNYDVGSVPGKILYCHCGAPNCRGRLL